MMQRHQTNSAMNLVNILGGIYDEDCVSLLNLPTSGALVSSPPACGCDVVAVMVTWA